MSRLISWRDEARRDAREIVAYIAADSPLAAQRWHDDLLAIVEDLGLFPLGFRAYEPANDLRVRVRVWGNYKIVYRVTDDAIDVLTIYEGHRLPPAIPPQP